MVLRTSYQRMKFDMAAFFPGRKNHPEAMPKKCALPFHWTISSSPRLLFNTNLSNVSEKCNLFLIKSLAENLKKSLALCLQGHLILNLYPIDFMVYRDPCGIEHPVIPTKPTVLKG